MITSIQYRHSHTHADTNVTASIPDLQGIWSRILEVGTIASELDGLRQNLDSYVFNAVRQNLDDICMYVMLSCCLSALSPRLRATRVSCDTGDSA
jgi:hypothetical protein